MRAESASALVPAPAVLAAAALLALSACGDRAEVAVDPRVDAVGSGSLRVAASGARKVAELTGFDGPETVLYDPDQDVFFVSSMIGYGSVKDGAGYISRVHASDLERIETWAQSGRNGVTLDAPKGMALHGDTLWVTDIHVLRAFDRRTGAPLATVDLRPHGAMLLNDVAVGPRGRLYATDSGLLMSPAGVIYRGAGKIFVVGADRAVSLLEDSGPSHHPNGIVWDRQGERWVVVTFDRFVSEAYSLDARGSSRTVLARGEGRFDGVDVLPDGRLLVTSWNDSSLLVIQGGERRRVIAGLSQPADFGIDTRRGRVAIPLVMINRVEVWELSGERR